MRTLEQINTDLASLYAVRSARMAGTQLSKASYDGRASEFVAVTLVELNQEITRLELERSRLTGQCRFGPIGISMGPW
jgi:hypothetical protein